MIVLLAFLICLGAGTIGGVFFAFSCFVMKALAERPPPHGIGAMQRINVVVLNPLFLGVFMGSAVLAGVGVIVSLRGGDSPPSLLLLASGLLYFLGTFVVTMVCNVPRNRRLAALDSMSAEAAEYWSAYVREWTFWNHVRTLAAIASTACAAGALAS